MNKKVNKKNKKNSGSGLKPPTIQDVTIRGIINDLLERGQIPVLHSFAKDLGFSTSHAITYFLKGNRNFPKAKVDSAISILERKYGANRQFLQTGHGRMYKGKPYMSSDSLPKIDLPDNILTIQGVKRLEAIKALNDELKKKCEDLERHLREKEKVIQTQEKLIRTLEKAKR